MNEKEKKAFYVATCQCCLLARDMKACETCRFKIGLAEKIEATGLIPVSLPIPIAFYVMPEQQALT